VHPEKSVRQHETGQDFVLHGLGQQAIALHRIHA